MSTAFSDEYGLERSDITHWIAHTGGPKVLRALEEGLELPPDALKLSWSSLDQLGNLSSASVLFVLAQLLGDERSTAGSFGPRCWRQARDFALSWFYCDGNVGFTPI